MAYAAATCLLLYLHHRRSTQQRIKARRLQVVGSGSSKPTSSRGSVLAPAVQLLEVLLLAGLAGAVFFGRVYLGYHTVGQVAAGAALGAGFAAVWWQLTRAVCQRWSSQLLALPPLRALYFRNTLGHPNVHAAEEKLYAAPAAVRPAN